MRRSLTRLLTWLMLVLLLSFAYFGLFPYWEAPVFSQIGKLRFVETWGIRALPQVHSMLAKTNSILVKDYAIGIVEDLHAKESLDPLLKELGYNGRWWVAWWDYEERNKVDGYRSIVAGVIIRSYGKEAVPRLLDTLKKGSEPQRYWSAKILAEVKDGRAISGLQEAASSDSSAQVRAEAEKALRRMTELRPNVWTLLAGGCASATVGCGRISAVPGVSRPISLPIGRPTRMTSWATSRRALSPEKRWLLARSTP